MADTIQQETQEALRNLEAWMIWFSKFHDAVCPHRSWNEHGDCPREREFDGKVDADTYFLAHTNSKLERAVKEMAWEHHSTFDRVMTEFRLCRIQVPLEAA